MWIFTRYGMFSISWDGRMFLVRSRVGSQLQLLMRRFSMAGRMVETRTRDYRYRVRVSRKEWLRVNAALAEEQTWSNFKEEAERYSQDEAYVDALHDVWHRMGELQPGGPYGLKVA